MPGQEELYRGEDVIIYRSVHDGIVELEQFKGLSPWDCKRSEIIMVNEAEGVVEARHVEWTCNAGARTIATISDPDLARDFAERIRSMKPGYQNVVEVFNELYNRTVSTATRRDEEITKLMDGIIDVLEGLGLKGEVLGFLRRARVDAEARQRLLELIEDYVNDP